MQLLRAYSSGCRKFSPILDVIENLQISPDKNVRYILLSGSEFFIHFLIPLLTIRMRKWQLLQLEASFKLQLGLT